MNWLAQNWVWIVVAAGLIWMMRRGGMPGCGMGHAHHGGGTSGTDSGIPPAEKAGRSTDPVSGKALWESQLGVGGVATPISYELDGKQYIAVMAGISKGRVYGFALDAKPSTAQ